MSQLKSALLILALVCFLLAAANMPWPRPNFTALGLFFGTLALLIA